MPTQAEEITQVIEKQQVYKVGASPLLWGIMEQLEIESQIDEACPSMCGK